MRWLLPALTVLTPSLAIAGPCTFPRSSYSPGSAADDGWRRAQIDGADPGRMDPWDRLAEIDRDWRDLTWLYHREPCGDGFDGKLLNPPHVQAAVAWDYIFAARDFAAEGELGAATQAMWTAAGLSVEGSRPDRERVRSAAYAGLAELARAREQPKTAELFDVASELTLTYLASDQAAADDDAFYGPLRQLLAARKEAAAQAAAARAARANALMNVMTAAVQGSTELASGIEQSGSDGAAALVQQGTQDLTEAAIGAISVAEDASDLKRALEDASGAIDEAGASWADAVGEGSAIGGADRTFAAEMFAAEVSAAPDPMPYLADVARLANGHPALGKPLAEAFSASAAERQARLAALAQRLQALEKYAARVERLRYPISVGSMDRACAVGDTTSCLELANDVCAIGEAAACGLLGRKYLEGTDVPRSPQEAARYLGRACDGGDGRSCGDLAGIEASGAVAGDPATVARHYEAACQAGASSACHAFGVILRDGVGVDADPTRARRVLALACAKGEAAACTDGALLPGTRPEDQAALLRKACDGGDADGCLKAGTLAGPTDDLAVRDLTAACEGGLSEGCETAAVRELAIDPASTSAPLLLEKACAAARPSACDRRGDLAASADPSAAGDWYHRGCVGGDPGACRHLGRLLQDGGHAEEAVSLFDGQCRKGDAASCGELAACLVAGTGAAPDPQRAVALYLQACGAGDGPACWGLAQLYRTGAGVEADPVLAASYARLACASGVKDACVQRRR